MPCAVLQNVSAAGLHHAVEYGAAHASVLRRLQQDQVAELFSRAQQIEQVLRHVVGSSAQNQGLRIRICLRDRLGVGVCDRLHIISVMRRPAFSFRRSGMRPTDSGRIRSTSQEGA